MFINLSNHPSERWGRKQAQTALEFGNIEDIHFPQIDPNEDEGEVKKLAVHYHNKIVALLHDSAEEKHAVHIMGESTFCFFLVTLLKARDITCVASTTERVVKEINGEKISTFNFVKFRRY